MGSKLTSLDFKHRDPRILPYCFVPSSFQIVPTLDSNHKLNIAAMNILILPTPLPNNGCPTVAHVKGRNLNELSQKQVLAHS